MRLVDIPPPHGTLLGSTQLLTAWTSMRMLVVPVRMLVVPLPVNYSPQLVLLSSAKLHSVQTPSAAFLGLAGTQGGDPGPPAVDTPGPGPMLPLVNPTPTPYPSRSLLSWDRRNQPLLNSFTH